MLLSYAQRACCRLRESRRLPLALVLLVAAQLLLWTLVPLLTYRAMPLDVVEGIVWGRAWEWGYYKHPPLPSWLLAAAVELPGGLVWSPYLLSQLAVAATYLAVWELGCTLLPRCRALVGVLLLSGLYYYGYPTPEFNHNVAQMPLWAFALLAYRRALTERRLLWWLALGATAALALLTKYSAALLLAAMACHLLLTARGRRALAGPGPWLALLLALLLLLPHVGWLIERDFAPFAYASARARPLKGVERVTVPLRFLLVQLLDHAGLLALLAAGGLLGRRTGAPSGRRMGETAATGEALAFLLWFALGPLALLVLASAVFGVGLRDMWGAPFFCLSGLLAVALLQGRWSAFRRRAFAAAVTGLVLLVPAIHAAATLSAGTFGTRPRRVNFPAAEATGIGRALWQSEFARPLAFVVGDEWLAGTVSLLAAEAPQVLLYGNWRLAPWVEAERFRREGALVVWDAARGTEPPAWASALPGFRPLGFSVLSWPDFPEAAPSRLGWGVVPPGP